MTGWKLPYLIWGAARGYGRLFGVRPVGRGQLSGVALGLRVVLAVMFVVAGAAKLADLRGSRAAVEGFGVPGRLAGPVAVAIPVVELVLSVALVPSALAAWAAVAAFALLSVFVVVIAV